MTNNNKKKYWCYVTFFAPMSGPIPIEAVDEKEAEETVRKGLTEVKDLVFLKVTTESPEEFIPTQEHTWTMDEEIPGEETPEKKVLN